MTLRWYLATMISATLACWGSWIYVLWSVNPQTAGTTGLAIFYGSLALALTGTGAVVGFFVRFIFLRYKLVKYLVLDSFRQALLFTLLIILSLMLLSYQLFSWLNLFFLIIGLSMLELFMISYRKTR
jgi:hypothetical protein